MDYIKSFLLVKGVDAVTDDKLAWLSSAHLPFLTDTDTLLVFNINKYYLHLFVKYFHPSEWGWSKIAGNNIPDDYADMFIEANQIIGQNAQTYIDFTRSNENSDSSVHSELQESVAKTFNGTGFNCWKRRYYLSRGLLNEDRILRSAENAVGIYKSILREASEATNISCDEMNVRIYFEPHTFFSWAFQSSQRTRLSFVEIERQLAPLHKEMYTRIKGYGFERNINSHCSINGYLELLGLEFPNTESAPDDRDVQEYDSVTQRGSRQDKVLLNNALVFGVDSLLHQYVIINAERDLSRLIDLTVDYIMFSRNIPSTKEEYGIFFENVKRQIQYNTSLPYYQHLPNCSHKAVKKYDLLKGLDARATTIREVIPDEPNRVLKLKINEEKPTRLLAFYIANKIGHEPFSNLPTINIICVEGSPIIQYLAISWKTDVDEYDKERSDMIFKWFESIGLVQIPAGALATGNTIVRFFEEAMKEMPELKDYFHIA